MMEGISVREFVKLEKKAQAACNLELIARNGKLYARRATRD